MARYTKSYFVESGKRAAITGILDWHCPLEKGTKARKWWMEGYNQTIRELHATNPDSVNGYILSSKLRAMGYRYVTGALDAVTGKMSISDKFRTFEEAAKAIKPSEVICWIDTR